MDDDAGGILSIREEGRHDIEGAEGARSHGETREDESDEDAAHDQEEHDRASSRRPSTRIPFRHARDGGRLDDDHIGKDNLTG
jgi:hypothetical protein